MRKSWVALVFLLLAGINIVGAQNKKTAVHAIGFYNLENFSTPAMMSDIMTMSICLRAKRHGIRKNISANCATCRRHWLISSSPGDMRIVPAFIF